MKVLIKKDCQGSENGYTIRQFKAEVEYDISEKLANSLIKKSLAVDPTLDLNRTQEAEIQEEELKKNLNEELKEDNNKKDKELEKKMLNSPENKAVISSPENKNKIAKVKKITKSKKKKLKTILKKIKGKK